jgi:hypothetical protein
MCSRPARGQTRGPARLWDSSALPRDQRNDEQYEENDETNLRDQGSGTSYGTESKKGSDERDDQEKNGII